MNNRQIETSREIRLWITGIISPLLIGGATILANDPELLQQTKKFVKRKYTGIKNKFKKEEAI